MFVKKLLANVPLNLEKVTLFFRVTPLSKKVKQHIVTSVSKTTNLVKYL